MHLYLALLALASCTVAFGAAGYDKPKNAGGPVPYGSSESDVIVTAVVTKLTTYCPSPTTITHQNKTYTVTSPTTLTITDCPCTITTPIKSIPAATVTAIVSSFTTVCPTPTTLVIKSQTYTVTSSTTLTITNCPGGCTIITPIPKPPPATGTAPPSSLRSGRSSRSPKPTGTGNPPPPPGPPGVTTPNVPPSPPSSSPSTPSVGPNSNDAVGIFAGPGLVMAGIGAALLV